MFTLPQIKTRPLTALLMVALALAPVAAAQTTPALPQTMTMQIMATPHRFQVKTADGLTISAQEWGNPRGPELVFVHGMSQSYLAFARQVQGQLARDFRIITYDQRGHGESDKPLDAGHYEGRDWGEELHAVMKAAHLKRPVVVAWSYGGRVLNEYLKLYGDRDLAGINYVSALTRGGEGVFGSDIAIGAGMTSLELPVNIKATADDLRALTARPMSANDFETALAFNMVSPPQVRANMLAGLPAGAAYEQVLRAVKVPVLVTHGEDDQVLTVGMARYTATTVPGAKLSLYPGVKHMPFYEDVQRFNTELAQFTWAAQTHAR